MQRIVDRSEATAERKRHPHTVAIYTILNSDVDKHASGFFVVPRRNPAGLLAASQGDSTQAQRKRRRRIVYIWVENSMTIA